MQTKTIIAGEIKAGMIFIDAKGTRQRVTHARKSRRYTGYIAVQHVSADATADGAHLYTKETNFINNHANVITIEVA